MDQGIQTYEQLIQGFTQWAQTEREIRVAIVIGSQARTDYPADQWSDLDIAMFVNDPQRYLSTPDWVKVLGTPWLTFVETTGDGRGQERRVLFAGGLDVDFAIFPVSLLQQMTVSGIPSDAATTLRRGVRVLLDKDQLLDPVLSSPSEPEAYQPPSASEFFDLIHDFWYHAVWTAKKLRRGERWTAKGCSDSYMKWRLLRLLEWHAHSIHGWDYDTWHGGRFLEQWASPRIVEELGGTFAHYEEEDLWHGLWATMDLFRWVAIETASRLGYPYPTLADNYATGLVKLLFTEKA